MQSSSQLDLEQCFSTKGTWEVSRGYAKFENPLEISPFLGLLGGYNFDSILYLGIQFFIW
jgi:hypothetical protein